jgi:acyl-CoA synthetase (AMP-forming)/AMP-acid ligase II
MQVKLGDIARRLGCEPAMWRRWKRSYIQIVDRTKDLVKSGGEWISSVDSENAIMAHPKVAEAEVIGGFSSQMGGASGGLRGAG